MSFPPYTIARISCVALMLVAAGCGKKDAPSTAGGAVATSEAVRVADVKVGRAIGSDKRLTDETDEFRPTDIIYVVVETRGSGASTPLQARWTYQDGQVVDESSQTIAASGEEVTEFHVSKPGGWPKGKYKVEILLNGASAGSEDFEVK